MGSIITGTILATLPSSGSGFASVTLPYAGNYLLFFHFNFLSATTALYLNVGAAAGPYVGGALLYIGGYCNINGSYVYSIASSATVNLHINYNGSPTIVTTGIQQSVFYAVRIG